MMVLFAALAAFLLGIVAIAIDVVRRNQRRLEAESRPIDTSIFQNTGGAAAELAAEPPVETTAEAEAEAPELVTGEPVAEAHEIAPPEAEPAAEPVTELPMAHDDFAPADAAEPEEPAFMAQTGWEPAAEAPLDQPEFTPDEQFEPEPVAFAPEPAAPPAPLPVLVCTGYGAGYGTKTVLSDVSLEVLDQGITTLMGPVGTGKSTLLRALAGMLSQSGLFQEWGQVFYRSAPAGPDNRPLLVAQRIQLIQRTALENLTFHLRDRAADLPLDTRRNWATQWLTQAGAPDVIASLDRPFMELDQLSQRIVTILREAAAEPALLMIDEPTTGLAEAEAGVLLAILERLAVFTPLLVVLQNQKHARRISSSVVLLAGGRVQAACGAEAFFDDPANPAVAQFLATGTCTPLPPDATAKPAEPPAAPAFDPNSLAAIKDEIRSALASEIFPQEPAAAEAAPEPELELAPVEAPVADLPAAPEEPEVEELQPEEIGFEASAPAESGFGETAPEAEQPMAEDLPSAMAEPEDILPETYADEATYAEAPLQEPQAVAEPVVLEPEPAEDDATPVEESAAFTPDFVAEPAPVAEAAPESEPEFALESEPEFALEPVPETAPDTEADVPPPVAETYEPAPDADVYEPAPGAEVYEPEPEAEVSEAEPEAAFIESAPEAALSEPAPEAPWADAPAAEAEPLPPEFAAPEEAEDFSAPESLEAEPAPYTAGDEFLPEAQDDAWAAPDAAPLTDEPEPAAEPEEVMEDLSPEPEADAYTAPVDEILETTEEPEAIAAEAPALVDEPAPEPETAGEPEIIEEPAAIEEPVAAELVDEVEIVTEEEDIIVAERVTGPIARGPASTGSVLIDMLSDDEDDEPESLDDLPPISLSAQMIQSVPLPPRAATLQSHDPQRHEDAAVTRYPGSSGPGPRGFVWIEDGRLAATPMPGFSAPMDTDLEMLKRAGITVLITLTEQDFPQEVLESHGLRNVHFPIADNKAPTTTDTDGLVNKMRDMLNHGEVLAVHCLAGLGRTGTVLAAYMVKEKGVSAQVALNQIRRFNRQFVQTDDQEDFLVEYEVQQEQTDLLNRAADSTKYLK